VEAFKRKHEINRVFNLSIADSRQVVSLTRELSRKHLFYLRTPDSALFLQSWIGAYRDDSSLILEFLFQTSTEWDPPSLTLTDTIKNPPILVVEAGSQCLIRTVGDGPRDVIRNWTGVFKQARVIEVKKSQNKAPFLIFFGRATSRASIQRFGNGKMDHPSSITMLRRDGRCYTS
jgi:hypothetical protein